MNLEDKPKFTHTLCVGTLGLAEKLYECLMILGLPTSSVCV